MRSSYAAVWVVVVAVGMAAFGAPAFGQFEILSDYRVVAADAELVGSPVPIPEPPFGRPQVVYDSQMETADYLMPLNTTLRVSVRWTPQSPVGAVATAWHNSWLSQDEIYLSGGSGDLDVFDASLGHFASGFTQASVRFRVAAPTLARVRYERVDPPYINPYIGSDAGLYISGPGIEFDLPPGRDPRSSAPLQLDEVLLLQPGEYIASGMVNGVLQFEQFNSEVFHIDPASFLVHIHAMPIPEPATWVGVCAVIAALVCARRRLTRPGLAATFALVTCAPRG